MNFFQFNELLDTLGKDVKSVRFEISQKSYIFKFVGRPTHLMFPYGAYASGYIYECVFFPEERVTSDDKFSRANDNSISHTRAILQIVPKIIVNWVNENKPVGYYWKGDDARLQSIWGRLAPKMIAPGYVRSKNKSEILVQERLQKLLDTYQID